MILLVLDEGLGSSRRSRRSRRRRSLLSNRHLRLCGLLAHGGIKTDVQAVIPDSRRLSFCGTWRWRPMLCGSGWTCECD